MFEVGKSYRIVERDSGNETMALWKVEAWEAPLLKLSRHGDPIRILNTSSPSFFEATEEFDVDKQFTSMNIAGIKFETFKPQE